MDCRQERIYHGLVELQTKTASLVFTSRTPHSQRSRCFAKMRVLGSHMHRRRWFQGELVYDPRSNWGPDRAALAGNSRPGGFLQSLLPSVVVQLFGLISEAALLSGSSSII